MNYGSAWNDVIASTVPNSTTSDGRTLIAEYLNVNVIGLPGNNPRYGQIFICPSSLLAKDTGASPGSQWDSMLTSKAMSYYEYGSPPLSNKPLKLFQFKRHENALHELDSSTARTYSFNPLDTSPIRYRHNNRSNFLFLDGHVQSNNYGEAQKKAMDGEWSLSAIP